MIEKETFENLLREVLPHLNDIREILEKYKVCNTTTIRLGKDGFTDVEQDGAEYTKFNNGPGTVRISFPLEL